MWVLLFVLSVPLIEIGLFVTVGGAIGLWPTLAWVILSAALGVLVLKRVARHGAVTLRRDMGELHNPLSPIAHRVMVVLAGGLLFLPGFFTDAVGLLLLIRPVRIGIIKLIGLRLSKFSKMNSQTMTIDGDWQEVSPPESPAKPSNTPSDWTRH